MFKKVEICGVNTATLKLLSNDEKNELLKKIKSGDSAARDEMINGNLRLVLSVIQRFSGRCDNPDDLFQVGCIGLIKSIDNFDMSQGVRFSTYAVPMIIGEVRRYLRDNNMIRVSRSLRDLAYKALSVNERLAAELGREATLTEITDELNRRQPTQGTLYTEKDVSAALDAVVDPLSLYEPIYSDNGDAVYLMDQLSDPDNNLDNWTERLSLDESMSKLTNREKEILRKRFFLGKTQMEIAGEIGISQAQVSRIEKAAVSKMKSEIL